MELCVPNTLNSRYFVGGKARCSRRFVPSSLDNLWADGIDWICKRSVKFMFLTLKECFVTLFNWSPIPGFLSGSWFWGHFGIGYYDLLLIGFGGIDLFHFEGERCDCVFWVFRLQVEGFDWCDDFCLQFGFLGGNRIVFNLWEIGEIGLYYVFRMWCLLLGWGDKEAPKVSWLD